MLPSYRALRSSSTIVMTDQQLSQSSVSPSRHSLCNKKLPPLPLHSCLWVLVQRFYQRYVSGWWAWELLSAAVSVLAMIGLFALLLQADKRQQESWTIGNTQLTLNTLVAVISTIMRSSLLLSVAGSLNQSAWNWFAAKNKGMNLKGKPLKDLEVFSDAAANSLNSMKLLYRTKGRFVKVSTSFPLELME